MDFLRSELFLVILVFVICIANFLGNLYAWNWTFGFYDTTLHFLGGFWIAALVRYGTHTKPQLSLGATPRGVEIILTIGITALIAIGWEWFEFLFDAIFHISSTQNLMQPGLTDTIYDLLAGVIGGVCYSFLVLRKGN